MTDDEPELMSDDMLRAHLENISPVILRDRIVEALNFAWQGQYDGAHHKQWALDQIARALLGEHYEAYTGCWDEGSPP
jgi:hypothetical protein